MVRTRSWYACSDRQLSWERGASSFEGRFVRGVPPDVCKRTVKKLFLLDTAVWLEDLRVPPGNRLEKLGGNRAGQHSIRVNDQWRICFIWYDGDAHDVEFVDYHD
ncbi:type II toxin-antitoxin system RelE/ParE family toxin [Starkeya sp. ORNL1]|nr:type II toxin-antitoxin system RelE/ParE family toxin [Starkeya sp. ORNL1]QJP13331.1 type II toxin-antitoxin system RelE/ParE family toxin [Starkeya sp. ORNL1]